MARRLQMQIEYVKCRTWGHAWDDFIPVQGSKRAPQWGKRFSLRCERCATERHDTFDGRGELSTRHYDYPSDYQLAQDERPELTQLRLHLVSELREKAAARNGKGKPSTGRKAPTKKSHLRVAG